MQRTAFRRVFRGLFALSVPLPFFVFSKATLMAFGGPLVWLLGYPMLVVAVLAMTSDKKRSKRIHATPAPVDVAAETAGTINDEACKQLRARINNPVFSFLSCNIHHRD